MGYKLAEPVFTKMGQKSQQLTIGSVGCLKIRPQGIEGGLLQTDLTFSEEKLSRRLMRVVQATIHI